MKVPRHRTQIALRGCLAAALLLPALALAVPGAQAKLGRTGCLNHGGAPAFDQTHKRWTAILQRYVHGGSVDYAGLKARGRAGLDRYLRGLAAVCPGQISRWSKAERIAFWVNTYNAQTVRLILDHYPISSIRSVGFLPNAAFHEHFIDMGKLWKGKMSLDDIEHKILRKRLFEPRIHFALVCASKSCPALASSAYVGAKLERQLDDAARAFLADRSKNRLAPGGKTLRLSKIFKWYGKDFRRAAGSLRLFLRRYAGAKLKRALDDRSVRIKYLDYDWSLNE